MKWRCGATDWSEQGFMDGGGGMVLKILTRKAMKITVNKTIN